MRHEVTVKVGVSRRLALVKVILASAVGVTLDSVGSLSTRRMLVVDAMCRASTLVLCINLIRLLFTLDDATLLVILVCIMNLIR